MLCYAMQENHAAMQKERKKLRYANYGIPSNSSSMKSRVNEKSAHPPSSTTCLTLPCLSVCLSIFLPRLLTAHQNPSSAANFDEREHDGEEESVYGKQRLRRKWFPGRQLARQFCH